ncbi:hypothetical protein DFP72DRAFT_545480 [Ephemerocybe angulata]|uniref:F-box domain-containing protein n=1 Tax=Ephemerocybe angulata TaxID=980116 RepID=A0A8H6HLQ8_9AGAR|nr:hypothetical protein DFP72DRAFT_545480 [Tulosesus angulatus]
MNQCLGVAEIQSLICENLDRKSAFAMALTAHAFLEPALNEIWRTVDSFRPLIDCLPDDLWTAKALPSPTKPDKINTILHVAQEPQAEDLRRYLTRYAYRIRNFKPAVSAGMKMLSPDALLALQYATDFQPGALSPQLKHFQWISLKSIADGLGDEFVRRLSSYMILFVGKTVDSINLSDANTSTPLEMAAVRYILKRLPCLKLLRDLPANDATPLPESLVTLVRWDRLESAVLAGNPVTVRSLRHLASLPRLRQLTMMNLGITLPQGLSRAVTGFTSLQDVTYACDRLPRVLEFLQHLPQTNIVQSILFMGIKFCTPSQLTEALRYAETYLNPETLFTMEIREKAGRPAPQSLEELIETDQPDPVDLQPLHVFSKLKVLCLKFRGGVRLTSKEIEGIPTTWPNLRVLILLPTILNSHRFPSIDHIHVSALLRSLPLLRKLGLQFNTTQILSDEPNAEPWVSDLQELSVGASPISSPSRVIDFIKAHLPRLSTLTIPKKSSGAGEGTILERRWEAVHQGWKQCQP